MSSERPGPARVVPSATYRLQLRPGFGFDEAAALAPYLRALGVSHAYLSPILQATPGSTHGYDVVDHSRLSADLGGPAGFTRLAAAMREHGLGLVVDVVPNHMAVATPATLNRALWSVLRDGPQSPYAGWFDVDWAAQQERLLMPVLGQRVGECLDAGDIRLDRSGSEPVLRYHEHALPVRPGTEELPLAELLDGQHYRLAYWRVADEELNYRRFFDVTTLAGLRVEDDEVFSATHDLLLGLVGDGTVDGLRIDHPDGLADPAGYLRRLAERTAGAWVVMEKVLEGHETLPTDWACAGTSGYDALLRVCGVFVSAAGEGPLTDLYAGVTGQAVDFATVVEEAKRDVVEHGLYAEVTRLVDLLVGICRDDIRLRDHTRRGLREALVELLVAFPVYRAYVVPGEPLDPRSVQVVDEAVARARQRLPAERHATLDLLRELVLGLRGSDPARAEVCVRFQQTCGPVMAKGVEDTAFYRWFRLAALNEVGGDPTRFGIEPAELHDWCTEVARQWPATMTSLSTHDTKRSEDVRARLAVLSEVPEEWGRELPAWRASAAHYRSREGWPDPPTEHLFWQTLLGAWPIGAARMTTYLQKAVREAKRHTSWVDQDPAYEDAVRSFAECVLADQSLGARVASFVERLAPHTRANVLGQKLLQLTMPGVPDVYQGCEVVDLSLVDPDNRRPVDHATRAALLAALDAGQAPDSLDAEKLLVTSRALRLRREQPAWFGAGASYSPLSVTSEHALAFCRCGEVVSVVSRLTSALARAGGWGHATLALPGGSWRDLLTGVEHGGGDVRIADLLTTLPVALLVRATPR